jgi:hypothetical protein
MENGVLEEDKVHGLARVFAVVLEHEISELFGE